jgi:hypothetical protein
MDKLEIGEMVKLNGNETVMVVEGTYDDNVICVWHDKNALLHREVFNLKMIETVNEQ